MHLIGRLKLREHISSRATKVFCLEHREGLEFLVNKPGPNLASLVYGRLLIYPIDYIKRDLALFIILVK